ncbi:MAG: hypothetical protein ACXAEF_05130 [Candidatus Thorarchaeota archaeon]|jgi:hypothetical protein
MKKEIRSVKHDVELGRYKELVRLPYQAFKNTETFKILFTKVCEDLRETYSAGRDQLWFESCIVVPQFDPRTGDIEMVERCSLLPTEAGMALNRARELGCPWAMEQEPAILALIPGLSLGDLLSK